MTDRRKELRARLVDVLCDAAAPDAAMLIADRWASAIVAELDQAAPIRKSLEIRPARVTSSFRRQGADGV